MPKNKVFGQAEVGIYLYQKECLYETNYFINKVSESAEAS